MSADIMSSLCDMDVQVRLSNFSAKTTRPRDMLCFLFFLKIAYLSSMKNCARHADLFVCLFARAIISKLPPTLSKKILTLLTIFSVTIAGISLISCTYVLGHK